MLTGLKPIESSPDTVATRVAEPVRQAVAGALADAWLGAGAGRAVGLMRSFDPLFWEVAGDRDLPARDFTALAGEVQAHLDGTGQARTFLLADLGDPAVTLTGLMQAAGAVTSRSRASTSVLASTTLVS